jgi:hemoglobin-like flavoprotein
MPATAQATEAAMTPEQQVIVQTSFAKVAPIADLAATMFYEDLFRRDPRLRPLFKDDMTEQRQKLMTMLGTAVANLRHWDEIEAAVRALGRRHAGYGVKSADYDTVGAALIATLEKGLGDDFTPEVRAAWLACYAAITAEMLGDAAAAAPPGT